jgi:hypothetical protein
LNNYLLQGHGDWPVPVPGEGWGLAAEEVTLKAEISATRNRRDVLVFMFNCYFKVKGRLL